MTENMCEAAAVGSRAWQHHFNAGNAAGCASCYEQTATMVANPYGTFYGRKSIEKFWAEQMHKGLGEAEYTDFVVMQIDENTAIVTGEWSINNTASKIVYELWARQNDDGLARIREECLEISPSLQSELMSFRTDSKINGIRFSR